MEALFSYYESTVVWVVSIVEQQRALWSRDHWKKERFLIVGSVLASAD